MRVYRAFSCKLNSAPHLCEEILLIKTIAVFLAVLLTANLSFADTTTFKRVKYVENGGHQIPATLTLSDSNKAVEVRPAKANALVIPYDHIDKLTYEYEKKHRYGVGAIVLLAVSVVGGIVVMCTQSKKHWLDVDYHDQEVPRSAVIRLDKRNYKKVIDAVKTQTGKDVEYGGCRMCKLHN
jgi:hypothetical protein